MKKVILVLMFLCCSFLYAETEVAKVNSWYGISFQEKLEKIYYDPFYITSILPYQNGYVMKLQNEEDGRIFEYFITEGFIFYIAKPSNVSITGKIIYKCKIINIKPNEFTFEKEEIGSIY